MSYAKPEKFEISGVSDVGQKLEHWLWSFLRAVEGTVCATPLDSYSLHPT